MKTFKEYGFIRKRFMVAHYGNETGSTIESNRGCKFGYTKNVGNPKTDDVVYKFNIIPENNEWICEIVKVDYKLARTTDYKAKYITRKRWAYMMTKEDAFNEMIEQYGYMMQG